MVVYLDGVTLSDPDPSVLDADLQSIPEASLSISVTLTPSSVGKSLVWDVSIRNTYAASNAGLARMWIHHEAIMT